MEPRPHEPSPSGAGHAQEFGRIYDELRALASARLSGRGGSAGTTPSLQATAVVHEVWLKLADAPEWAEADESHYFAIAAQAMRWILVDRARRRRLERASTTALDAVQVNEGHRDDELLALDAALAKLERVHPRKAAVVAHRYFAGLSVEETGRVLGTSPATVKREWSFARAWLIREMAPGQPPAPSGEFLGES